MQLENVTSRSKSVVKRIYDDACGLAHALELIGERWALLVMRELMYGPRRFSELKADLPGISANILTQRLGELEERGLVRRRKLAPPASVQVYEATDWGREAAPLIGSLGRWAARSPLHDPTLPLSHVAVMMSLETMFDPARAGGLDGRFGFRLGLVGYVGVVSDGAYRAERQEPENCDVLFTCSPTELAAVIYGGAPLESIAVEGDMTLARRFVTMFPLPSKAG